MVQPHAFVSPSITSAVHRRMCGELPVGVAGQMGCFAQAANGSRAGVGVQSVNPCSAGRAAR